MAGFPDNLFEKNPNNNNNNKISSIFNRSLTIHSSAHDFSKKNILSSMERNGSIKKLSSSFDSIAGKVKSIRTIFESSSTPKQHQPQPSKLSQQPQQQRSSTNNDHSFFSDSSSSNIRLPGTEDRVVVYFTSLRGIRRTYEDCYAIRMILRGFRIHVDERDISMDSAYKKELQGVLEHWNVLGGGGVSLPQVFVKGKYVGGAERVKHLNEIGELKKMLKGLAIRSLGCCVCDMCGDVRFVPCMDCNGSRKVYDEDEERMRRCVECNENGLIRCPTCCCS